MSACCHGKPLQKTVQAVNTLPFQMQIKLDNMALTLPASEQCSAHAAGQTLGAAAVLDSADGTPGGCCLSTPLHVQPVHLCL